MTDANGGTVYECPLDFSDIHVNDCETFASQPRGTSWEPRGLLVDSEKRLVYIADTTNSFVHTFTFDRVYLGPLAETRGYINPLVSPTAMAMRPAIIV